LIIEKDGLIITEDKLVYFKEPYTNAYLIGVLLVNALIPYKGFNTNITRITNNIVYFLTADNKTDSIHKDDILSKPYVYSNNSFILGGYSEEDK
jgi:hypothetical protein